MVKGPSVSGDPHEGKRLHTAISAAALKLAEIESDTPTVSTGELLAGLFRHARGKFSALKMERGMLLHSFTASPDNPLNHGSSSSPTST